MDASWQRADTLLCKNGKKTSYDTVAGKKFGRWKEIIKSQDGYMLWVTGCYPTCLDH